MAVDDQGYTLQQCGQLVLTAVDGRAIMLDS